MTRAVRVWAALGEDHRERIRWDALGERYRELTAALDADLAEHDRLALTAPPYQGFLIPDHQTGPRTERQTGHCACGREVGTELFPWVNADNTVTWLGSACWRERALRRAEGAAGHQLEVFRLPPKEAP